MKFHGNGRLEVICGSMFAGKSGELICRIPRAAFVHRKVLAFKHALGDRMVNDYVHAHNGQSFKAIALEKPRRFCDKVKCYMCCLC